MKNRFMRFCKRCGKVYYSPAKRGRICDDCIRPNHKEVYTFNNKDYLVLKRCTEE